MKHGFPSPTPRSYNVQIVGNGASRDQNKRKTKKQKTPYTPYAGDRTMILGRVPIVSELCLSWWMPNETWGVLATFLLIFTLSMQRHIMLLGAYHIPAHASQTSVGKRTKHNNNT